jgi:hypothetical protein
MMKGRMTVELEKALDAVWLAMDYYREEGISGDEFEKERVELGAQFNLIESTLSDLWHEAKREGI